MSWIESHQALATHRKTMRACAILGIDRVLLIGHLHLLWWWGLDNATPLGELGDALDGEMEMAADWRGEPGAFVAAITAAGFLDRGPEGRALHDWWDYAGKLGERRERTRAGNRQRQHEYRSRNALRNGAITRDVTPRNGPTLPTQPTNQEKIPRGPRASPHHSTPDATQPEAAGAALPLAAVAAPASLSVAVAETPDGAPQKQRSRPEPAPEDLELARLLAKRIRENNPSAKITAAQGPEWANECRLMRERDGRTPEQIRQHIDWAQRDAFWRLNCLSMGAVRKHWDRNALAMADAASARDETPGYRRLDSDEARREVGLL